MKNSTFLRQLYKALHSGTPEARDFILKADLKDSYTVMNTMELCQSSIALTR